jgi:hypothetical protein
MYAAYVNGNAVTPPKVLSLGDHSGGAFAPDDVVPSEQKGGLVDVVINDPTSIAAFSFQLVNNGNKPATELSGRLAASADQIASLASNLIGADEKAGGLASASGGFLAGLGIEALINFYEFLAVDCDGPVAVDQISGPRYVLDAWTNNSEKAIKFVGVPYIGTESPIGCGEGTSAYRVSWSLHHVKRFVRVQESTSVPQLTAAAGVCAAAHSGALFAVAADVDGLSTYRTFAGATWTQKTALAPLVSVGLPPSAISFNDRLYVFGVQPDGTIKTLVFTVEGGAWTSFSAGPPGLQTASPFATVEFRNRLYVIARDAATQRLRLTSTDDMVIWASWSDVPEPSGVAPAPSVAAVSLDGLLHIFGVYPLASDERRLLHNSSADAVTWTGWRAVEAGVLPPGVSEQGPLDVAAGIHQNRIYLASRWQQRAPLVNVLGINFSADGENWSGWRFPDSDNFVEPGGSAALASINNHLYVFVPEGTSSLVWVY